MTYPALATLALLHLCVLPQQAGPPRLVDTLALLHVGETNADNVWVKPGLPKPADLAALKQHCTETAECDVAPIKRGEHFEFFYVRTTDPELSITDTGSISLLGLDSTSGIAYELWAVEFRGALAKAGDVQIHPSRYGEILEVRVLWKGTGHGVTRVLFLWHSDAWLEIDGQSWQRELALPPCYELREGLNPDFNSFSATTPVWIMGDGGCCPMGGKLTLQLELVDRAVRIEQAKHDPADSTYGRPGSIHDPWRQRYLADCLQATASTDGPALPNGV